MKKGKTQRGFGYVTFKDHHKTPCTIQKSSLATDDAIWFGADTIGLKEFVAFRQPSAWRDMTEFDQHTVEKHYIANNRIHLTRRDVAKLLPILIHFVKTGNVELIKSKKHAKSPKTLRK